MLNYPLPGQPVKVQADMGSDNAQKVHKHGGNLSGNQYKVLTHIAWTAYDPKGIPKGAKDRDGNPAKPFQFFGNAQASALEALGRDKKPAVAVRLWERAVKELADLGILKVVERAIPNKRTALHEIDVERLEMVAQLVDKSAVVPKVSEQKVREPSEQKVREPLTEREQKVRQPPEVSEQKVPAYLQALTKQDEFSNQKGQLATRSRRAVSSPRAREPKLLANNHADLSAYEKARDYLAQLGPDGTDRVMEQARTALGANAPVTARVIHAAQLAGHTSDQERAS